MAREILRCAQNDSRRGFTMLAEYLAIVPERDAFFLFLLGSVA